MTLRRETGPFNRGTSVTTGHRTSGNDVQNSYDRVAGEYARRLFDELDHKPLDRQMLDRFAASVRDLGTACDLGCGPGHVTRYLHDRGARVVGVDLSPEMVSRARELNPGITFSQGDMRALDIGDGALGGVVAFYSIIHVPRSEVVAALTELRRVLRPGGRLLLTFHLGEGAIHRDEWWGHKVSVRFVMFRPDEMRGFLNAAGFEVEGVIERDPYPDVEYPTRRAYAFARKPAGEGTPA